MFFELFSLGPGGTVHSIDVFPPPWNPGRNPGQNLAKTDWFIWPF